VNEVGFVALVSFPTLIYSELEPRC
jgi:hypothetical protein